MRKSRTKYISEDFLLNDELPAGIKHSSTLLPKYAWWHSNLSVTNNRRLPVVCDSKKNHPS